ncbi:MAG: zinc-dependent alcohol dehydrogenase family protein [Anaerolineae bacterium]
MKAAQIVAPENAQVIDREQPVFGSDDVLIRVAVAGICGTDLHIFKGEYEAVYPLIPGHEFSGTVAAVGQNVKRFKVGDRVTADPNIPCNRCPACQRNEPNQCESLAAVGVTRDGAFAEYVVVPEGNVFPMGDLTFEQAAFVEPLACVVWGLKRVQIQAGDSVLIFGAGPMGNLLLQAVKHSGATKVVITDSVLWRLETAASLGATETILADAEQARRINALEPSGYHVVVDATGIPSVLEQTFGYARPRGKIWVFGVTPRGAPATFIPYDVFRKDLSILGSFAVNRTFQESIALIQSGAVKVEPLVSHTLALEDFPEGLNLAQRDPRRMKVQFAIS